MDSKLKTNLILVLTGYDLQSGQTYIISIDKDKYSLLIKELDDSNIPNIISKLVEKYVDLDPNWVAPRLKECFIYDNELYLIYHSIIPLDTRINDCYWIPILGNNFDPLTALVLNSCNS